MRNPITYLIDKMTPLFLQERLRTPKFSNFFIVSIFLQFLQCSFLIFAESPTSIIANYKGMPTEVHIMKSMLLIPWYFSHTRVLFDSLAQSFVHQVIFLLIFIGSKRAMIGKFIQRIWISTALSFIVLQIQIFNISLYFRTAYVIDCMITLSAKQYWPYLLLNLFVVLENFFVLLIFSVFLRSFDITPRNQFDLYEGRHVVCVEAIKFLIVVASFTIRSTSDISLRFSLVAASILCSILTFVYGVLPYHHVSFIGAFLETSPSFFLPVVSLLRIIFPSFPPAVFYAMSLAAFSIILYLIRSQIRRRCLELFQLIVNGDPAALNPRLQLSPINMVSVVRMFSIYICDPSLFSKFRSLQRTFERSSSLTIEVARFICLFPSERLSILSEIDSSEISSPFDKFTLLLLKIRLKALTSEVHPMDIFDDLWTKLASHLSEFWNCMDSSRYIKAYCQGMAVSVFCQDILELSKNLVQNFPFNPEVRRRYIESLILLSGDTQEINIQQFILDTILKKKKLSTDPILHEAANRNPRIIKYLKKEEKGYMEATVAISVPSDNGGEKPVHAYLTPPPKPSASLRIISASCITLLAFGACLAFSLMQKRESEIYEKVSNGFTRYEDQLTVGTTAGLASFASNGMTMTDCSLKIAFITYRSASLMSTKKNVPHLSGAIGSYMSKFFLENKMLNICGMADNFVKYSINYSAYGLMTAISEMDSVINEAKGMMNSISENYQIIVMIAEIVLPIFSVIFFVRSFSVLISRPKISKEFFKFLGSSERFALISSQQTSKSWDLMPNFNPSTSEPLNSPLAKQDFWIVYSALFMNFFFAWILFFGYLIQGGNAWSVHWKAETAKYKLVEDEIEALNLAYRIQNTVVLRVFGAKSNTSEVPGMLSEFMKSKSQATSIFGSMKVTIPNGDKMALYNVTLILSNSYNMFPQEFWVHSFLKVYHRFSGLALSTFDLSNFEIVHNFNPVLLSIISLFFGSLAAFVLCEGFLPRWNLGASIGCIFIFPHRYVDLLRKLKVESENELPESIIVISFVHETGIIYSVSGDTRAILGRNPENFVGCKMWEIFGKIKNEENFLTMRNKIFRASFRRGDKLTKVAIVEDTSRAIAGPCSSSVTSQFAKIMPQFFADAFEKADSISMKDVFLIFIILPSELSAKELDSICSEIMLVNTNFANAKVVKTDGSLVVVAIYNSKNSLGAAFLTKDLILKIGNRGPIKSIFLSFIDELRFTYSCNELPSIRVESKEYADMESAAFHVPERCIYIDSSLGSNTKNVFRHQSPAELKGLEGSMKYRCVALQIPQFLEFFNDPRP